MADDIDPRANARRRARGDQELPAPHYPAADRADGGNKAARAGSKRVQREKQREYGQRWRAANQDKMRRYALEWRERNPERAREQNRQSARRSNDRRRKKEVVLAKRRAHYAVNRDRILDRKRQWSEAHPDKAREYHLRWKGRHPERAAESDRRSSQKYWDSNADQQRAATRDRHRERYAEDPDYYRRYYQRTIEQRRAYARETNRLRSRLKKLGLPPRIRHHVPAEQRRANDAAADAFFSRRRTPQQKEALKLERTAAPHTRLARLEARGKADVPPPTMTDVARITAVNKRAWESEAWPGVIPNLVRGFVHEHRARLTEEIRLDSIARQYSGKPAYDPQAELLRRMRAEGFAHVARILIPDADPDATRHLHQIMFPRLTHTSSGPTGASHAPAASSDVNADLQL